MRILFILPRQHPNQASWYHALENAGHTVKYIVSYSLPTNERRDLPEPVIIDEVPLPLLYSLLIRSFGWFTRKEIQRPYLIWPHHHILKDALEEFSPDIIIVRECLTPLSLVVQSIAIRKKIPTVHYSQAPIQKQDGLLFRLLRGSGIVPKFKMSPTIDPVKPAVEQDDSFYIPLFVPAAITAIEGRSDDTVRLLFVGKYIRRKNHLLLIEAFNEIRKTHKVELTMVGSTVLTEDSCQDEIIAKINTLDLSKYITVQYDVDPLKMKDLYISHDIFVLPSIDEPFSISPLEAMAYGLPVIVSDTNGCRFHIREGENGFVVKSNDLDSLIHSLKKMMNMRDLSNLKSGALNYAIHNNNENNFLERFEEMISIVTSKKN